MSTHEKTWSLHPKLEADCHRLLSDERCEILLHRNSQLHWILLVPKTTHIDLLDLPAEELANLMQRARVIGRLLKSHYNYPRVNVGALGLLVPQLHLHVIGRSPTDPCWPNPIWGQIPDGGAYSEAEVSEVRGQLKAVFGDPS